MVVTQDLSLHKRFWTKVDSEDWDSRRKLFTHNEIDKGFQ